MTQTVTERDNMSQSITKDQKNVAQRAKQGQVKTAQLVPQNKSNATSS